MRKSIDLTDLTPEELESHVKCLLDNLPWLSSLKPEIDYEREHDDTDGSIGENLSIVFGCNGDVAIRATKENLTALRFRTFNGGGHSLRVINALMILALAIQLDNEEFPQQ